MSNLNGVFGMFEMEQAACVIIDRCKAHGSWTMQTSYQNMTERDQQTGFLHLLNCVDLLRYVYYKDSWYPTQRFIDQTVKYAPRFDFGGLPKVAPTADELARAQLPSLYTKETA